MTMTMTMMIKTPLATKPEGKTSFHCFWQEGRARGLRDMWLPSHFGPSQQTWWSSWWWWWWWWWTWRRRQWWRCWTFLLWAKTPSWSRRRCARLPGRAGLPLDRIIVITITTIITMMITAMLAMTIMTTMPITTTTILPMLIKVETEKLQTPQDWVHYKILQWNNKVNMLQQQCPSSSVLNILCQQQ